MTHLPKTAIAIGYRDNGDVASWNYDEMPHAMIAGMTGSGKTSGAATWVVGAMRRHFAVAVLDAKPGTASDWDVFGRRVQVERVDRDTLGGYIRGLGAEFERRQAGQQGQPILVVMEEFLRAFRWLDEGEMGVLRDIAVVGRSFRIHLLLVAQQIGQLPDEFQDNTQVVTFRQGTHRAGSQVGIWGAFKLQRGEFVVVGGDNQAWKSYYLMDSLAHHLRYFGDRGIPVVSPLQNGVVEGVARPVASVSPEAESPRRNVADEIAKSAPLLGKWSRTAARWFEAHPEYLEADRNIGVNDLARKMAVEDGRDVAEYEPYKGTASRIYSQFREAWQIAGCPALRAGRRDIVTVEQLRQMAGGEPLYVNGQRVGPDKSNTIRYGRDDNE